MRTIPAKQFGLYENGIFKKKAFSKKVFWPGTQVKHDPLSFGDLLDQWWKKYRSGKYGVMDDRRAVFYNEYIKDVVTMLLGRLPPEELSKHALGGRLDARLLRIGKSTYFVQMKDGRRFDVSGILAFLDDWDFFREREPQIYQWAANTLDIPYRRLRFRPRRRRSKDKPFRTK